MVEFELPPEHVQLSDIFSKMERGRDELNVEDYSVCQNTLDNVSIGNHNSAQKVTRKYDWEQIDGLVQDYSNSSALAMELL